MIAADAPHSAPPKKIDPTPWVFISDQFFGVPRSSYDRGYHGTSGTWWAFSPRPEYSQNREDYE